MQNDIAPKSSLMLGDFASGVCFSNKVYRDMAVAAFLSGLQG